MPQAQVAAQRQASGGVVERDGLALGRVEQARLLVRALDVCASDWDWDCSLERRTEGGAQPAVRLGLRMRVVACAEVRRPGPSHRIDADWPRQRRGHAGRTRRLRFHLTPHCTAMGSMSGVTTPTGCGTLHVPRVGCVAIDT